MQRPKALYTTRQNREIEKNAINSGVTGYQLMCRAGQAALQLLRESWPEIVDVYILCGTGNNGGDGLVLARLAKAQGLNVTVYVLGDEEKLKDEARGAIIAAKQADVMIMPFSAKQTLSKGLIVDALIGIGLHHPLRDQTLEAIAWVNQCALPVLALDIASGVCADTGSIMGDAVQADKTISFIAAKRGAYTGAGSSKSGCVLLDDLAVPDACFAVDGEVIHHPTLADMMSALPKRPKDAHKGLYGHVLVVGGDYGMAGAVIIAAKAAARIGAGLISVATRPEHLSAVLAQCPEVMAHGVTSGQELTPLLVKPNVIIIGPGLGQSAWSEQLLQNVLMSDAKLIIDADALNLISVKHLPYKNSQQWVLTPHPGEAGRLLEQSTKQINADRFASARALQQRYAAAAVVLKGAGSLVCTAKTMSLCSLGNPGMASGGMGDLLSGIIAALIAQNVAIEQAVLLAVLLHAKAADDVAAQFGERGMLASDLLTPMRSLINGR